MDAFEYLKKKKKMIESLEGLADFDTKSFERLELTSPDIAVLTVEEACKTRQSEFLKIFPDADRYDNDGEDVVVICPAAINIKYECPKSCYSCIECKKRYWLSSIYAE